MTIIYGGVTLVQPEEPDEDLEIIITKTRLLSGKNKIQVSDETGQNFKFRCHTTVLADITNLISLIGTAGTLSIDGTLYTNCYIESFKKINEGNGNYTYEISFVRDTT